MPYVSPTRWYRGGLVVVQEDFGVNQHIRSVADRFAAKRVSYAVAPALFRFAVATQTSNSRDAGEDVQKGMAAAPKINIDLRSQDVGCGSPIRRQGDW